MSIRWSWEGSVQSVLFDVFPDVVFPAVQTSSLLNRISSTTGKTRLAFYLSAYMHLCKQFVVY